MPTNRIKMPVFFLAHGSPMNAIEDNFFVQDWLSISANTPTPKAIVVFSAHWQTRETCITANEFPPTIHDFAGFPHALFKQRYPAPGDKALAYALQHQLTHAQLSEQWGLDHGTWAVLTRLYPKADIPVLQISLKTSTHSLMEHIEIGRKLRIFREQGVLFIGSGNIVHNIPKWFQAKPTDSIEWAEAFDQSVANALLANDQQSLVNYQKFPFANDAVPTNEHYLPLLYCVGLRDADDNVTFSKFPFHNLATCCSRSVRFG